MPQKPQSALLPPLAPVTQHATRIARLRRSLDWILLQPSWETDFEIAIAALGFKGQRQGIALRKALLSLPIIHKLETIRYALRNGLATLSTADTRRLASQWAIARYGENASGNRASQTAWFTLCQRLLLRLSARQNTFLESRNALFAENLPLIERIVADTCRRNQRADDARQEASIALLEAIDRIEPGSQFSAYARQWIRRRLHNFIMTESVPVAAPINLLSKSFQAAKTNTSSNGLSPTLLQAIREGVVSLDAETSELSENELAPSSDSPTPIDSAIEQNDKELLSAALASLSDKQATVLHLRFGFDQSGATRSLAEVAKETGISRQQVLQREKRALKRLAESLQELARER